jgi:phosphate starvation-inducible protein PhoH
LRHAHVVRRELGHLPGQLRERVDPELRHEFDYQRRPLPRSSCKF